MKMKYRIILIVSFIFLLTGIIAFARGYRIDFEKQTFTPTGIIAVSAFPRASKVYINGQLKGASDLNVTLPPGTYQVEVKKDGYTSWSRSVKLKGELVLNLDVLLFPLNASLTPLSNLGIVKAIPLPQSNKIILFSQNGDETKDGIYLFDSGNNPLSFFPPLKVIILKKKLDIALGQFELADTQVDVSPDFKEAIFTFKTAVATTQSYLLTLDEDLNPNLFDISTSKETLIEAWDGQKAQLNNKILQAYPKEIARVASDSFHVVEFSPDETKVLYSAKQNVELPLVIDPPLIATNQTPQERNLLIGELYVYDKKEDRNYKISKSEFLNSNRSQNSETLDQLGQLEIRNYPISWYSDSKHFAIDEGKKISVMDFDGENKQVVYSGPFQSSFFKVSTDGKIIVLINLNPETNKYPDLYSIGIK